MEYIAEKNNCQAACEIFVKSAQPMNWFFIGIGGNLAFFNGKRYNGGQKPRTEGLNLRRWGFVLLALMLVLPAQALAEASEQWEWAQDFDGDGELERFFIDGAEDKGVYVSGDLTYEDGGERRVLVADGGWAADWCAAWQMDDGWLFNAEESYGIGGSASHVYFVSESGPEKANGVFEKLQQLDGSEFAFEMTDTDRLEGGFGRTHKRYYVHWQDGHFLEHGGVLLLSDDVRPIPGVAEVLDAIEAAGNRIKTVYYRANDILNLTYCDGETNGNATLLLKDGQATLLDTSGNPTDDWRASDYGGMYQQISGRLQYVTYPEQFPEP